MNTSHDLLQAYKVESFASSSSTSSSSSSKLWKKSDTNTNIILYNVAPLNVTERSNNGLERSIAHDEKNDNSNSNDDWYCGVWDTIVSMNEKPDEENTMPSSSSSSECMERIRSELIDQLKILCKTREPVICKIIHACIGHIHFR